MKRRSGEGPATLGELIVGVGRLGLLGFGGVGPQAYHVFVESSGWLDDAGFADVYSLAQALPGANVVNMCAIAGDRWFGPAGAVAAVAAITVPPLILVLVATSVLERFISAPRVIGAESAIVAASAGLIAATAWRVLGTIARRRMTAVLIAAALALTIGFHVLAMPVATLIAAVLGIALDLVAGVRR